jgi:hypothetical protein
VSKVNMGLGSGAGYVVTRPNDDEDEEPISWALSPLDWPKAGGTVECVVKSRAHCCEAISPSGF